ncbi:FAD binding domain-containing protein [Alicyclobacillus ferrooxydans]|uniref:FAD-binding PCMH-type domain-containing protein n=1 Tax=Alicyclobacillus ferrooxydans TaxID=471514 RepID=A0A0P9CIN1_9BACL|nr:FAD binding domain-containing protein [Alicyclobacillus ferrooxydans]KPV42880.1 hypothetical protein AN477_15205 [Alicyclobacillus ferrooxydans]
MTTENPLGNSPYVWRPHTVEEAWAIKQRFGEDACYVAGGTLLQLQWEGGAGKPRHLISLEGIQTLTQIRKSADEEGLVLDIGALCKLGTCKAHPLVVRNWPLLAAACGAVGSPAVRNRATLGGNVANGHGDTLTALLALDGELLWFDENSRTSITTAPVHSMVVSADMDEDIGQSADMDEDIGQSADMNGDSFGRSADTAGPPSPSRLLMGVRLRRESNAAMSGLRHISIFRKLGRRAAFVPSLVTVAASCVQRMDENAGSGQKNTVHATQIDHVRLVVGAIDFAPRRLTAAERLLEGAVPSPDLWHRLHANIMADLNPPDHAFASADYRRLTAANVLVAQLAEACSGFVKEGIQC